MAGTRVVSRLIIVSNRVAPISEGGPAAGGLAVGVYDALKETGGVWFGWSGDVVRDRADAGQLEQRGPVTFATVGLRATRLRPVLPRLFERDAVAGVPLSQRPDPARSRGIRRLRRVNAGSRSKLAPLLKPDDVIWVHDYHLIPFAQALRDERRDEPRRLFPAYSVSRCADPAQRAAASRTGRSRCAASICSASRPRRPARVLRLHRAEGGGSVVRHAGKPCEISAFGKTLKAAAYPIGVYPDEIAALAKTVESGRDVQIVKATLHERKLDHERRPARLFEGTGRAFPRVRAAARASAAAAQQRVASCRSRRRRAPTWTRTAISASNWKPKRVASTAATRNSTGRRSGISTGNMSARCSLRCSASRRSGSSRRCATA